MTLRASRVSDYKRTAVPGVLGLRGPPKRTSTHPDARALAGLGPAVASVQDFPAGTFLRLVSFQQSPRPPRLRPTVTLQGARAMGSARGPGTPPSLRGENTWAPETVVQTPQSRRAAPPSHPQSREPRGGATRARCRPKHVRKGPGCGVTRRRGTGVQSRRCGHPASQTRESRRRKSRGAGPAGGGG